jgi:hypothetical protein
MRIERKQMFKKVLLIALLAGITGILVWGGVNRTQAKSNDSAALAESNNGRGNGGRGSEPHNHEDCEEGENEYLNENGNETGGYGQRNTGEAVSSQGNSENANSGQGNSRGTGGGNGQGSGNGQGGREPLDEADIQALELALDDEYHALAVYQSVIADFGNVEPFVEIAQSEQRHIDALLNQFDKHGLAIPENPWLGNIPGFESVQAACQAGVEAEIANVALYERLFSMTDDPTLVQVFTNLSRASQGSHLPEFQSCQ